MMCVCHTCPEHGDAATEREHERRVAFGFAQQIALADAGWYEPVDDTAPETFGDDQPEFSVGDLMAMQQELMAMQQESELAYTEVYEVQP